MGQEEFVRRTEALRSRLYRTAFAYLGGEAAGLEAVDEAVALRRVCWVSYCW